MLDVFLKGNRQLLCHFVTHENVGSSDVAGIKRPGKIGVPSAKKTEDGHDENQKQQYLLKDERVSPDNVGKRKICLPEQKEQERYHHDVPWPNHAVKVQPEGTNRRQDKRMHRGCAEHR